LRLLGCNWVVSATYWGDVLTLARLAALGFLLGLYSFPQICGKLCALPELFPCFPLPFPRRRLQQLAHLQGNDRPLAWVQVPPMQVRAQAELHRVVAVRKRGLQGTLTRG
jgi:hypothetical protein